MKERNVEAYLVARVKKLGGEVRKVQWIGCQGAPDRCVMLPVGQRPYNKTTDQYDATLWIELKAPGLKATFPANAHERAQHREHERMRKCGQTVLVIDSYEGVDEVLR